MKLLERIKRIRPEKEQLLIGVLLGLLLLVIAVPVKKEAEEDVEEGMAERTVMQEGSTETLTEDQRSLERRLEGILSEVQGVGAVQVMITYADSGKRIIEKDSEDSSQTIQETDSAGGTRVTQERQQQEETVYAGEDTPYLVQELAPAVEGVLVIAQGAGDAKIKQEIMEAIEALFGLEAHKIKIMKMEVSS